MSLLRRRTVLRRFFAALERIASNVGLIREAGKEFRLFSAEASLPASPHLRFSAVHPLAALCAGSLLQPAL